jgi:hypothetical protein
MGPITSTRERMIDPEANLFLDIPDGHAPTIGLVHLRVLALWLLGVIVKAPHSAAHHFTWRYVRPLKKAVVV